MREKKTFRLATLGCRTNQYETQAYRDQLLALGLSEAKEGQEADYCIVNTCTVTEGADRSSRQKIARFVRENRGGKIVVTGCVEKKKVAQIKGVSLHVPNVKKDELVSLLFPETRIPEFSIKNFEAHTRAFVKVQDGCNSFCTYCILPYVRGRSRSRPIKAILEEVRGLVTAGYKEVVITGINVGDFVDGRKGLADLMQEVDQVEGLRRLRLSSIDPDEIDDHLLNVILQGKTTCKSMHVVLQSGSNVILKRMNRKYTRQIFLETIDRIQRASPDFTFTTDVIVGFPGETEIDFKETLEVIEEVGFAKVHMFPFSIRERTRAALYPNQLPEELKKERKRRLMDVAEKRAFRLREAFVGRTLSVLTESDVSFGHTDNFLSVNIKDKNPIGVNEFVEVELTGNTPEGLVGKRVI